MPGAARFLLARTKFIDEIVLSELAGGATQLVLLGAGYDSRLLARPRAQPLDASGERALLVVTGDHEIDGFHVRRL